MANPASLDPALVVATIDRLRDRIRERFPNAGLERVCASLADAARRTAAETDYIKAPNLLVRTGVGFVLALSLFLVFAATRHLSLSSGAPKALEIVQGVDASINVVLLTAAGVSRLLTMDLHAGQIQGFFNIPVDNLYATPILLKYIQKNFAENLVIVSPDTGGVERARAFARRLNAALAIIDKRREGPNESQVMNIIGNVKGKRVIILDDMIDTGGTIVKAAETLFDNGAADVIVAATHGILSDPARERLQSSRISEVVITNTLPIPPEHQFEKLTVLSIAPILAKAINEVFTDGSVTSMFEPEPLTPEASSH